MKGVTRQGDLQSGHKCYPPTGGMKGSSNVLTNGKQTMMVGAKFKPHGCPKPHPVIVANGYSKVLVNGQPIARIGSKTKCKATVIMGSGNVLVGG